MFTSAFGPVLLDVLLKGGLLFVLAHLGAWGLRRLGAPAAVRRGGWGVAFVALLLLPAGTVLLPALPLPSAEWGPDAGPGGQTTGAPSERPARPADPPAQTAAAETEAPVRPMRSGLEKSEAPHAGDGGTASAEEGEQEALLVGGLVAVWAAGGLVLVLRMGGGLVRIRRLRRDARVPDAGWRRLVDRLRDELGVRRLVSVGVHEAATTPMVLGAIRPIILLPPAAEQWPEARRRLALRHELLHLRRGDVILGLLARLARALHWPNPLVWTGWYALRRAQEATCDEAILRSGTDPATYARQLIDMAREATSPPRAARAGVSVLEMASAARLKQRIGAIVDGRGGRSWSLPRKGVAGAAALGLCLAVAMLRPLPDGAYPTRVLNAGGLGGGGLSAPDSVTVVRGRLLGADGTPLSGATVHAWGPQGDTTAVVGDRGRFALTLHRAGRHYLWVNTDRHRGQGRWTEVGPEADIRRWTVRLKRQQKGGPDSTFHARIQAAWDTVRKHRGQWEKRDSLQRRFAETFYRYYQTHPDTRTRWFALQSATMMWGNVGAVSKIDRLLGRMGPDSRAWPYVLIGLRGAYVHSQNERDRADYARLLRRSMDRVTPPEGQAALRTKLARHYQVTDSLQRAKALHEDVVALDAGSLRTAKAQANIREIERLNVGQKAPSFRAETVRGRTISLSDLDGQVVLLLFWNPSCDPCGPELTSLRRTWSKYKDEGFRVVSVVLEDDDSRFRNHVRKRKASWPLVRQAGMDAPIPRLYGVNRIADVYLIDRTGRIAAKHFGARQLGKKLRDLLPAGQGEDAEPVAARPAAARQ